MGILKISTSLQELLWPSRCAACHVRIPHASGESLFCESCAESLMPITGPYCPQCGIAFEGIGPNHLCGECLANPPPFQRATAAFQYGGAAKDAILRLKYGRIAWIGEHLGRQLAETAVRLGTVDAVVPIPLHFRRLRDRGFNQSALIATPIARALNQPLRANALRRARDTDPQAGLTKSARAKNIQGAFVVHRPQRICEKKILLVDDVITTGETLKEAARVLLAAGAASVEAVAAARAC